MVILVAEDEALVRMITVETFKELGFVVLEASTGAEALAIVADRSDICALFTDVEMPGELNGVGLAHHVRKLRPLLPIVVSSGRALPRISELPTATRFLAKPYTAYDLLAVAEDIRQALGPG